VKTWELPTVTPAEETFGARTMLYLTALAAVAALIYLTYAMIRPERF
jgi:K+-transporting ATPase KdpF subunit